VDSDPVTGEPGDREPLPPTFVIPNEPPPPDTGETGRAATGLGQQITNLIAYVPALVPAAILVAIAVVLLRASEFHNFGLGFWGISFNSNVNQYGMAVFIIGSFLTALPALFLSMVIGLGIAIASTTYLPSLLSKILDPFVDLLAGIPSVVYGIWAFLVLAPVFGDQINPWAVGHLSFIPGFAAHTSFPVSPTSAGTGLPLAIIVLTLMALPITTLLIRDALRSIPKDLWESGLALGATRWEVVRKVSIRHGSRGIISAAFLGFGRAIGETVAVAMVIGASDRLPVNVYDSTWTMAAFMYESLDAAYGDPTFLAALAELALVLLAITFVANILGRRLVSHIYAEEVAGI
jgi:phosphate transport system permease protein